MTSVRVQRKGDADAVLRRIAEATRGPKTVKVGFPLGKLDPEELQKAVWNEFGTEGSGKGFSTPRGGGFGGPIPERPFFRNAMRENRAKYRRSLFSEGRKILTGELTTTTSLNRLGLVAQGDIQQSIVSLQEPPNSPVTIALKGSSNPLVDTGAMRQAVTYELEKTS